jgi:hypothetical protein
MTVEHLTMRLTSDNLIKMAATFVSIDGPGTSDSDFGEQACESPDAYASHCAIDSPSEQPLSLEDMSEQSSAVMPLSSDSWLDQMGEEADEILHDLDVESPPSSPLVHDYRTSRIKDEPCAHDMDTSFRASPTCLTSLKHEARSSAWPTPVMEDSCNYGMVASSRAFPPKQEAMSPALAMEDSCNYGMGASSRAFPPKQEAMSPVLQTTTHARSEEVTPRAQPPHASFDSASTTATYPSQTGGKTRPNPKSAKVDKADKQSKAPKASKPSKAGGKRKASKTSRKPVKRKMVKPSLKRPLCLSVEQFYEIDLTNPYGPVMVSMLQARPDAVGKMKQQAAILDIECDLTKHDSLCKLVQAEPQPWVDFFCKHYDVICDYGSAPSRSQQWRTWPVELKLFATLSGDLLPGYLRKASRCDFNGLDAAAVLEAVTVACKAERRWTKTYGKQKERLEKYLANVRSSLSESHMDQELELLVDAGRLLQSEADEMMGSR